MSFHAERFDHGAVDHLPILPKSGLFCLLTDFSSTLISTSVDVLPKTNPCCFVHRHIKFGVLKETSR
ncbi:MAG: hypothetical protein CMK50_01045 [Propionibacteriaceae bacterium]|nr:hypothetical protein [Propionibacteriaceae bacterium]